MYPSTPPPLYSSTPLPLHQQAVTVCMHASLVLGQKQSKAECTHQVQWTVEA